MQPRRKMTEPTDETKKRLNGHRRLLPRYRERYQAREKDAGLQPERTALSWFRTAFVVFVNSILLLRIGAKDHATLVLACGWFFLLLSIWLYYTSVFRADAMRTQKTLTTAASINIKKVISFAIIITSILLAYHFISDALNLFYF